MKRFHIDLEAIESTGFRDGIADVAARMTVRERADPAEETSVLNMSEGTMRKLHKLLGNHIRALDEAKSRT